MIEVVCDIGEVLTGIAVTEKPSHGLVPRCGVPLPHGKWIPTVFMIPEI